MLSKLPRLCIPEYPNHALPPIFLTIFSSPIFAFLRNKITEREFINKFGTFVQSLPTFQLKIECYHQTYRQRADYKSDYQTVVTHRENVALPYYSCRDISGLFHIGETNGKTFIKLKLIEDINFADNISYMDYNIYVINLNTI